MTHSFGVRNEVVWAYEVDTHESPWVYQPFYEQASCIFIDGRMSCAACIFVLLEGIESFGRSKAHITLTNAKGTHSAPPQGCFLDTFDMKHSDKPAIPRTGERGWSRGRVEIHVEKKVRLTGWCGAKWLSLHFPAT